MKRKAECRIVLYTSRFVMKRDEFRWDYNTGTKS